MPKLTDELIECVPNFSEGRDAEKVRLIAEAAERAGGLVLDVEMDPDHNRSVITFVAAKNLAAGAAFEAVRTAVSLLDISVHQGVHPRVGVADVVPFVPLQDGDMESCIVAARELGRRIAEEFGLPVYLYEFAALREELRNLADVRKLYAASYNHETCAILPPDFGPPRAHPTAGAMVTGARRLLVAFNCYLEPPDVEIARKIASLTRERGGGLPGVKALGLELPGAGRAQVSLNITDIENGPPHEAVAGVDALAQARGARVSEGELIGLVPLDSVLRAAASALRLPSLRAEQVLELAILNRREEMNNQDTHLGAFLDSLASSAPTPGGGAASALTGSLAAALTSMVCNLTIGKPRYADAEPELRNALERSESLRIALRGAIEEDESAYGVLMSAYKLPKDTDEQRLHRAEVVESALRRAADVPIECAQLCIKVLEVLDTVVRKGSRNAISDAGAAAALAEAAARSSLLTVRINASLMKDRETAATYMERMEGLERRASALRDTALAEVVRRIG